MEGYINLHQMKTNVLVKAASYFIIVCLQVRMWRDSHYQVLVCCAWTFVGTAGGKVYVFHGLFSDD